MKEPENCISCGGVLKKGVTFLCPGCREVLIGRCASCREQSVRYKCERCGFDGP